MNDFERELLAEGRNGLYAAGLQTVQVNVGLRCNLACAHCHLEAGLDRNESMSWETMSLLLDRTSGLGSIEFDITGGSPEMNPNLTRLIGQLRERGNPVRVRTNLVVLDEPSLEAMASFFREHEVMLTASLPCYLEENVTAQRGAGVYEKAIRVLRTLNQLGYGLEGGPELTLVYNPGGPTLPPSQMLLEQAYKKELSRRHKVSFTRLIAITNMPLGRFGQSLGEKRRREYLGNLKAAFNPGTIDTLMCRRMVNVGWDGTLADCDFNWALGILSGSLEEFDAEALSQRRIRTGEHCFGCTAGAGSSCGGTLAAAENE